METIINTEICQYTHEVIVELQGVDAHGDPTVLSYHVRNEDDDVVPRAQRPVIQDFARKHGLDLDVDRLYNVDDARHVRSGLTESQHDTLVKAYERGYNTIPRETDADELAAELGISHQVSVSAFAAQQGTSSKTHCWSTKTKQSSHCPAFVPAQVPATISTNTGGGNYHVLLVKTSITRS